MEINHENFTEILQNLDNSLNFEVKLILCGGISGIIWFGNIRTTEDIDVLVSAPKLSEINEQILKVGEKFSLKGLWLNDGAKGFSDYFVMKLASGRDRDFDDISNLELSENEINIVKDSIEHINRFDTGKSLKMDLFMKEYLNDE